MWPQFEALASSQLLLIWTAFEIMAGDLWEQAVNERPKQLASLTSGKPPAKSGSDQSKMLPIRILYDNKYDIKNSMGTIHRTNGTVSFQTLEKIKESYILAFPDKFFPGRQQTWEDSSLRALSALRNIIAHRAGRIDQHFIDTCGTHPSVVVWEKGDHFTVDRINPQKLFGEFCEFGLLLLKSVDNWIESTPE